MACSDKRKIGQLAEEAANKFLCAQGMFTLQKNYRCSFGEIDLIMQDEDDIVFVEVRSRNRIDYVSPTESINHNKIERLIRTAMHFLQKQNLLYKVTSRFDVIGIQIVHGEMQFEWIKNAFSAI